VRSAVVIAALCVPDLPNAAVSNLTSALYPFWREGEHREGARHLPARPGKEGSRACVVGAGADKPRQSGADGDVEGCVLRRSGQDVSRRSQSASPPALAPGVVKVAEMDTGRFVPDVGSTHVARLLAGNAARLTVMVPWLGR
jgi:hypothetical protein